MINQYSLISRKNRISNLFIYLISIFFYNCENTIIEIPNEVDYGIVINEINYRSSAIFNPEDWLELYNTTSEGVEVGLWSFKDDNNNVFIFPENLKIQPGEYLVLCKNYQMFSQFFPGVTNVIGDFGFGLSGGGELLRLFDANEQLVDQVEYNDIYPWPTEPDGTGPTLELINPYIENDIALNWASSIANGSPGSINSIYNAD